MCLKCIPTNSLSSNYLEGLPLIFAQAMRDLYNGRITATQLHNRLLTHLATELWSGVTIGLGDLINNAPETSDAFKFIKSAQQNVFVFSGFKVHHELREASLLMFDEAGKIKPFTQFLKDVQAINSTYNITYLRAEYDNAEVSGQMATKWLETPEDAILKFTATVDDRTTAICKKLDGITKPKSWSGWKKYWLPLHWGERSNIIQTFDDITPEHEDDLENPAPMFRGNVALDGVIFPDTHPYFNADDKQAITKAAKLIYKNKK